MRTSRGEVWLIDLGYVAKTRPGVILSIEPLDVDRDLVTLIPHTTSLRGTRFEVALVQSFLEAGAFDAQNPAPVAQAKLLRKLGDLTANELADVEDTVRNWLGL